MKEEFVRTADHPQNATDEQATPNEYSSDMLQEGMENIATEEKLLLPQQEIGNRSKDQAHPVLQEQLAHQQVFPG